jgi:hypothetical protein
VPPNGPPSAQRNGPLQSIDRMVLRASSPRRLSAWCGHPRGRGGLASCCRPPQVVAVGKDQSGSGIGRQLEVVITRSIPPAIRCQPGVLLSAGNDIKFGESDPCSANVGCVPDLEIQSADGNRICDRSPTEVDVRTATEVPGRISVHLPVANMVGSELDRADLR